jgi:hypothetical protein
MMESVESLFKKEPVVKTTNVTAPLLSFDDSSTTASSTTAVDLEEALFGQDVNVTSPSSGDAPFDPSFFMLNLGNQT